MENIQNMLSCLQSVTSECQNSYHYIEEQTEDRGDLFERRTLVEYRRNEYMANGRVSPGYEFCVDDNYVMWVWMKDKSKKEIKFWGLMTKELNKLKKVLTTCLKLVKRQMKEDPQQLSNYTKNLKIWTEQLNELIETIKGYVNISTDTKNTMKTEMMSQEFFDQMKQNDEMSVDFLADVNKLFLDCEDFVNDADSFLLAYRENH